MKKNWIIFSVLAVVVTCFASNNPFFWDTVQLASKHGHYFYDTHFSSLILPENIDSGHLPAFGMYIAACWEMFGKSLVVSHFAMLPFLLGIGYFLLKIGKYLADENKAWFLLGLCFADPVLASQSILVSPDIVLLCFFTMGLYAVWVKPQKWLLIGAVIGLGMSSMRGMMVAVGLFVFSLFIQEERISLKSFIKKIGPFVPGGLISAAFLLYHWVQTGWIGYHPNSPWAPSYSPVGLQGFIKNIAVLGWRMLDFGRVFSGLALVPFFYWFWKSGRSEKNKIANQLVILAGVIFLAIVPTQLFYKALLAHRYLLPFFVVLHLMLFYWLFGKKYHKVYWKIPPKVILILVIIGLVTGNLWVYPKKISQGWDSTLAHVHWYELQQKAADYLQKEGIERQEVGTAFPNIGPREWYELNGVKEGFVEKDLGSDCYILYSNIMNDYSDAEIDELEDSWQVVFHAETMGVCAIIYKNPEKTKCEN